MRFVVAGLQPGFSVAPGWRIRQPFHFWREKPPIALLAIK
jgi:hypothetical protein